MERKTIEIEGHSHHITLRGYAVSMANLDYLAEMVLVTFLHHFFTLTFQSVLNGRQSLCAVHSYGVERLAPSP